MVEVFVINSNTIKFECQNTDARSRILHRGMWNLTGIPVVMSKQTPFIPEENKSEAVSHFNTPTGNTGIDDQEINNLMNFECDDTDKQVLMRYVFEEEIIYVLFGMAE